MTLIALLGLALFPAALAAQEDEGDGFPGDETGLDDEQDFPDLVGIDETGGLMDEFAFLEEELADDEVKSASKHRQSIYWSPSTITVFTREDIRSSGATMILDLLRRVPNFDVYDLKPSYPIAGARALTQDDNNLILVLVDGREAMAEISGTTMWAGLTVDLEEIERIEVIRGPGSTLYGANAFAGVVNITTVSEPTNFARAFLAAGQDGFIRSQAIIKKNWDLGDGVLSVHASLGNQAMHALADTSFRHHIPFRTHGYLQYRLGQDLDVSLHAGGVLGNGIFYTYVGDMTMRGGLSLWAMAKGAFSLGENFQLRSQVYVINWRSDFETRTNMRAFDIWIADFPRFKVDFPIIDAQMQLDIRITDDLGLIAGANLRNISMTCKKFQPSDLGETRGAGFVQAQWTMLENLQLTGGLRLDISSETAAALSPRAVAVYRPVPNHSLRLGYGLAFRKPSVYESQVHVTTDNYNPAIPEILDKLETSLGNESLTNEKVHSIEAGWLTQLLDEQLRLSLDLFFNIYQDTISFVVELDQRLGMPNITSSTLNYENEPDQIHALGGEAEIQWKFAKHGLLWGNLGLRRVSWAKSGDLLKSEPSLRVNLGGRWSPPDGLVIDLALHYVSSYSAAFSDPMNIFNERLHQALGNKYLLIGRLAYRLSFAGNRSVEAGLTIRAPLGLPFREWPGTRMPQTPTMNSNADWGGDVLYRYFTLNLRAAF